MGGVSNSNLALKYKAKIFFEANAFTSFCERTLKRMLHIFLIQLPRDAEINLSKENECYKL